MICWNNLDWALSSLSLPLYKVFNWLNWPITLYSLNEQRIPIKYFGKSQLQFFMLFTYLAAFFICLRSFIKSNPAFISIINGALLTILVLSKFFIII